VFRQIALCGTPNDFNENVFGVNNVRFEAKMSASTRAEAIAIATQSQVARKSHENMGRAELNNGNS